MKLSRLKTVRELANSAISDDTLVVSTLGSASYYLFEVGDRDLNLYTFGAMGQAASIGLGLILAQPHRDVIVIDGDGSLLMNLGILGVIAIEKPAHLLHVVLDDGAYESTGGQPTGSSGTVDLAAVAAASGIERSYRVETYTELTKRCVEWRARPTLTFLDITVLSERGNVRPHYDPLFYRYRFREACLKGIPGS